MSNLIFFDLETTGLDPNKNDIIQVAWKADDGVTKSNLFEARVLIPFEISGITNIDREDVKGKGLFRDSAEKELFMKYAKMGYIAVTYNTDFDLKFLEANGIRFEKHICAFMLARGLMAGKIHDYKLGTVRAFCGIKLPQGLIPHDARCDVEVLYKIFQLMQRKLVTFEKIAEIEKLARKELFETWSFGKYKGERVDKVLHREYILWYITQPVNPKYRRDTKFIEFLKQTVREA